MTIRILRDNLLHALAMTAPVSNKNKIIPALSCINCEVCEELIVSAYDGECVMRCSVAYEEANVKGVFSVNARDFHNAVKSMSGSEVVLDVNEKGVISIKHSKGVIKLPSKMEECFTLPDKGVMCQVCTFNSAKLREWIKLAQNFASQDELRPMLNGMFLKVSNDTSEMCATDAHKMIADGYVLEDNDCEFEAIIPAKYFTGIAVILSTRPEVTIVNYDKNIEFIGEGCTIICRKVEGIFPNYKAIIPNIDTHKGAFTINKEELLDSAKRAGTIASQDTKSLNIDTKDGKLHITSQSIAFERMSEEFLDADYRGEIAVALKADYLQTCLMAIPGDQVTTYVFGSSQAVVFKDLGQDGRTILQMPMLSN